MPQPRPVSSRRLRGVAPIGLLLALVLSLAACNGMGGDSRAINLGSPRIGAGSRDVGPASQERPARAGQSAPSSDTRAPEATLSSSDLALVYRFILDRYVDRVDHAVLVRSAAETVRQLQISSGALPADTAPFDYAPVEMGNPDRDWLSFSQAYDSVVHRYPAWAGATRPDWAVLRKMIGSLGDSHSLFIEPDEFKRMNEGSFSGIGVRVSRPDGEQNPIVVEVFPNSPAQRAGLRPGDRIAGVEGKPSAGRSLTEVVNSIRGPQGTPVKLSVARRDQPPLDVQITRAAVDAPRVEGAVRGGLVGILRIRSFGEGVPEMVQQVLTQGRARGARAWVLDLRGNSGGAIAALARVAANWIDNRPVGIAVDRSGQRQPINGEGRPAIPRAPLVVLVDRETASGAEVLAAAIKEYQLGQVVGTTTAGSVGIASSHQLSDGSAVQITVQRLLSPSGAQIDRVGVQPDVPVDLTIEHLERGEDPQMLKAIELLLGRLQ